MRILIVEDEATAAQRLERLATAHLGLRLKEIVHAETVDLGRKALAASTFDLVLLDLDLNGADGFDIIRGAGATPRVVVVSARIDRAIDAFDNAVIDFVVKPVTQERLARALDRAMETASPRGEGPSLVVRSAGRIHLAPLADVMLLSGAGDYVEVTLADGRKLLHDVRLDDLEQRLPASWLRVHRSHIVNLRHVRGMKKMPGGRHAVELVSGNQIPVSRRRASQVIAALAP